MPARMRVLVTVVWPFTFCTPLVGIRRWRNCCSSKRPGSSSPTMPTGSTLTSSAARLQTALAPPPGRMVRSRCFRMSTGASRETREISPYTNSSATRSPNTTTRALANESTISRRRLLPGDGFERLLTGSGTQIFSRAGAVAGRDELEHIGNHPVGVFQFQFNPGDCQRLKGGCMRAQVDGIFLGGDEAIGYFGFARLAEMGNVGFTVGVMIAKGHLLSRQYPAVGKILEKIVRPS